ncbi:MAG: RNA-binding protein [Deltaproteobacteria bacterium]|nr:MAG: RNA-binding protein [Deltaproteobacteria bacterium]
MSDHDDDNRDDDNRDDDLDAEERLEDLIVFIAKNLVDEPDDVSVEVIEGERAMIYELFVGPDDLGKVIGKEGRTARAIRTLLSATSAKLSKRAVLDIVE